jgi:hypothetical protein
MEEARLWPGRPGIWCPITLQSGLQGSEAGDWKALVQIWERPGGSRSQPLVLHCYDGQRSGSCAGPRPGCAQSRPPAPDAPRPSRRVPPARRGSSGGTGLVSARGPGAGAVMRRRSRRPLRTRPRPASARAAAPGASDWRSAGPAGVGGCCGQAGRVCLQSGLLLRSRCRRCAPASCLLPAPAAVAVLAAKPSGAAAPARTRRPTRAPAF